MVNSGAGSRVARLIVVMAMALAVLPSSVASAALPAPAFHGHLRADGGVAPLYPAGGVTDAGGTRYIADSGGSRLVKISATGQQTVLSPETAGWNDPRDIDLDPSGQHLWVANTLASEIVKITKAGVIEARIGTGVLNSPYGLANDTAAVYVADTYNNSVVKLPKAGGAPLWDTDVNCAGKSLSRPRDVAVIKGKLYVSDSDNNRVAVLSLTTGACEKVFGTAGSATPAVGSLKVQFRGPRGLTGDAQGTGLWVADSDNARVQHLKLSGAYIGETDTTFGNYDQPKSLRSPNCVFRDGPRIAVCDTFNYRIEQYSAPTAGNPVYRGTLGGIEPTPGGFNGAFAVGYSPNGALYATDFFNHRVQKFVDGSVDWVIGGMGGPTDPPSFRFPRGVVVKPDGTVVVTNSENSRIDLFSPSGQFLRFIKATPPLVRPWQVALQGDTYWVADWFNDRVVRLSATGATQRSIALPKPQGVAVDSAGNVYAASGTGNKVVRVTPGNQQTEVAAGQLRNPAGLALSADERFLLIADSGNHRVVVVDLNNDDSVTSFGTFGEGKGQLDTPRSVAVNPVNGEIAVGDFGNNRVSLWR